MTCCKKTSSKLSYARKLLKAVKTKQVSGASYQEQLDAVNAAINYSANYNQYDERIAAVENEALELKSTIMDWEEFRGEVATAEYQRKREVHRNLRALGQPNLCGVMY